VVLDCRLQGSPGSLYGERSIADHAFRVMTGLLLHSSSTPLVGVVKAKCLMPFICKKLRRERV